LRGIAATKQAFNPQIPQIVQTIFFSLRLGIHFLGFFDLTGLIPAIRHR
jgi:hypothetical protein